MVDTRVWAVRGAGELKVKASLARKFNKVFDKLSHPKPNAKEALRSNKRTNS